MERGKVHLEIKQLSGGKVICAETRCNFFITLDLKARQGHRHPERKGCKKLLEKGLEKVLGRRLGYKT